MPLPLTVSCFSKIQIGFNFLILGHPDSPWLRAVKQMFVVLFLFITTASHSDTCYLVRGLQKLDCFIPRPHVEHGDQTWVLCYVVFFHYSFFRLVLLSSSSDFSVPLRMMFPEWSIICFQWMQNHNQSISHLLFLQTSKIVYHSQFFSDLCGICAFSALTLLVGQQEGIRPVKNWVVGCWHGYLSGERCRLAYGPADATATHCFLLQ